MYGLDALQVKNIDKGPNKKQVFLNSGWCKKKKFNKCNLCGF